MCFAYKNWFFMVDIQTLLTFIVVFEGIMSAIGLYTSYKFLIKPYFKFKRQRKKGFYVDIHRFNHKGEYGGSLENQSVDELLGYVGKQLFGITRPRTLNERIRERVRTNWEKNTDEVVNTVLSDKRVKTQMQRRIFEQIKREMGNVNDEPKRRK